MAKLHEDHVEHPSTEAAPLPAYLKQLGDYVRASSRIVVGLHSGTSADGPAAVVARVSGCGPDTETEVLASESYQYDQPLRDRIADLFSRDTATVDRITQADMVIGEFFAKVVGWITDKAGLGLQDVALIASSGQVCYQVIEGQRDEHRWLGDRAITSFLDLGSGSVIAERTGVTTVSNLRQRDIAAGGLGVPTVTYGDWVLFRDDQENRSIQNIGGISNPTVLRAGGQLDEVIAFDVGPGNMLIDGLVASMTNGEKSFDADGRIAASGAVDTDFLGELMAHPFIRQAPPKGAARQLFGAHYVASVERRGRERNLSAVDLIATATALTAESITFAYRQWILPTVPVDRIFVGGGGARNETLRRMLAERMDPIPVTTTEDIGVPVDAREVLAMVVIANDTVNGIAGNAPSATGAAKRVICGEIAPGGLG